MAAVFAEQAVSDEEEWLHCGGTSTNWRSTTEVLRPLSSSLKRNKPCSGTINMNSSWAWAPVS